MGKFTERRITLVVMAMSVIIPLLWGDPSNSNPQVFAEYNSKTASGTAVNVNSRRTSYTNGVTVILNDAFLENKNTGFTDESYANFSANSGSSVEIPVYVDNAGTVKVTITYANGSGTTRQLSISVNGTVQVVSLDFEATTDWTTWGTTTVTLSLNQGVNTITLATVHTADGPNIDKITLTPDPAQIRQCSSFAFNYTYNRSPRILHIQSSNTENLRVGIYTIHGKEIRRLTSVKFRFMRFRRGLIS